MMNWRGFPQLSALRAFAAFAQSDSLDQAGARIGVTHAAISQQIRALEAHLGLSLVERGGRKLNLTVAGRKLADTLDTSFAAIAATLADLTGTDADRPLRITTTSIFASGWLMPRLPDFRARHPDIDLMIDSSSEIRDIGREADVGLRYGNGDWPGLSAQLLMRSGLIVVAAPSLVPMGVPCTPDHLANLPWLQKLGTTEAMTFLNKQGLTRGQGAGLISLPGNLLLDAARDGRGVAIVARDFVAADLAAGRLRLLYEDQEFEGYHMVTRPGPSRPALQIFCTWLLRQAGAAAQS